jgi:large subunit ribosomal protein L1
MGKVRVKTIGIEEDEKEQKKKAKERAEAKRIEAAKKLGQETKAEAEAEAEKRQAVGEPKEKLSEQPITKAQPDSTEGNKTEENVEKKPKKKEKFAKKGKVRSKTYTDSAKMVDKNKKYTLAEALTLLPKLKRTKFDETVELHINTHEKGVSGSLTLPHGTGKTMKVEIADYAADPKHLEELVKKIEGGQINFDILIATPDSMVHLAKVAKHLGPRGLMPNPKNGTVHPKPEEAAKKFAGGQINFKTEAKAPIIHITVGKVSFGQHQLNDNINAIFKAVKAQNIKNVTLKSTMSPGIKITV